MTKPTDAQLADIVDEALKILDRLRKHGPTLLARDQAGGLADGYPTRSMGDGGSGDGTSSTERVALALWSQERQDQGIEGELGRDAKGELNAMPGSRQRDPIRDAARTLSTSLDKAVQALRRADAAVRGALEPAAVPSATPEVGSRERLTPACIACDRDALPRPRRGMCEDCYRVWLYQGHPEMARFREYRLRWLAEQAEMARRAAA